MAAEAEAHRGLHRLGLIVRSAPWCGRSGRDQLDLALAAASLELDLLLFFTGAGLLQLRAGLQGQAAGLPAGLKAWKSLPELTSCRYLVELEEFRAVAASQWWVRPEALDRQACLTLQAGCDRLLVL